MMTASGASRRFEERSEEGETGSSRSNRHLSLGQHHLGELRELQVVERSLLDRVLKAYVEEGRSLAEIIRSGVPAKEARWAIARVARNEYKRRQAPPGIRVTSKAFGIGRRYPIARKIT